MLNCLKIVFGALLALALPAPAAAQQQSPQSIPAGQGTYQDLVQLFDEFLKWRDDVAIVGELSDSGAWRGIEDWSDRAVAARRTRMNEFLRRIADMNVAAWSRPQQAEYLAVRAKLDEQNFLLNVSKPWERDPGFYVDRMLAVTFVDLPLAGAKLESARRQLRGIPVLVQEAKRNLDNVAADYADLALHNLSAADGVGHGHPYRATPPAGVVGWYDDLLGRVSRQPELRDDVLRARSAVLDFQNWLKGNRPRMTAQAGVGEDNFNWYLKNVKLMPYTAHDIVLLGERELDRLWAMHAIERNRNRNLPELQPAATAEEYQRRIQRTDRKVREFLVKENFITIPPYIKELDTNVPWIVRPQGRNFWEEIQYRDPAPDHIHAVIPGHRFDGVIEDNNTHPIRGRITDGARTEGWGVYLEEAMQRAGYFDEDLPRGRELIDLFGIFRAARVPADVWLQLNQMTVNDVIRYWRERVPYLDENVSRVDAEIYLRRPPGYGLGYTIGMVQMQQLVGDRKRQRGDAFDLKKFHDEFMAQGRLPLSVIRWEMTGLDDEVRHFWKRDPLPQQKGPRRR
jgi:hypothetical protein